MAERIKLEVVDDPVAGSSRSASASPPSIPEAEDEVSTTGSALFSTPTVGQGAGEAASARPAYGREERRAVFGRVPRSLSRRLERAVVELRDEFEDLTQEQVLAALLYAHVDPKNETVLARLAAVVRDYRSEFNRS